MRRALAALVVGVLLPACGGGDTGGTGQESTTERRPVTQQQIEQVLLDLEDLPEGYTVSAPGAGPLGEVFCTGLKELRDRVGRGVAARAAFTGPDQFSTVGQQAYYDPTEDHGVPFLRQVFTGCNQVTAEVMGRQVTFDVTERRFKEYGDGSAAFRVSGAVMGFPFGADFAAVSRAGVVNLVYVAGPGADHARELERLVDVTYARQERLTD